MIKKTGYCILLYLLIITSTYASSTCSIFIHGYTSNNIDYFGELPRQVLWDSSKNLEESAPEVAQGILEQMDSCQKDDLITLRPHSYGAAQVVYILGLGRRFQDKYPDHDYVKIYKKTFEVISYTGAYQGTPLMNLVCSNLVTNYIASKFGKSCVRSLLTNSLEGPSQYVNSPGIPTYLIYSTDRSGYYGTTGTVIAKYKITFFDFLFRRTRNQNDNTLPLASTLGCAKLDVLRYENSNCKKIDSNFFEDYFHIKDGHHTEFLKDSHFMLMGSINED